MTTYEAECDLNTQQAKGIVIAWYRTVGTGMQEPQPLLKSVKKLMHSEPVYVSLLNASESRVFSLTGGKGNSLALLSTINTDLFHIPNGFIVTVDAFKHQLDKNNNLLLALDKLEYATSQELATECEKYVTFCFLIYSSRIIYLKFSFLFSAVKLFSEVPVDDVIKEKVEEFMSNIHGESLRNREDPDCLKWAVRSSGIGEDSEDLSAAGQNSTFLGCTTNEQVLKAISQCWGSLFSFQSVQYRK